MTEGVEDRVDSCDSNTTRIFLFVTINLKYCLRQISVCENKYIKVLFMNKCSTTRGDSNVYHKITGLKNKTTISYLLKVGD